MKMKDFNNFKAEFLEEQKQYRTHIDAYIDEHLEMIAILTYIDFYLYENFESKAADDLATIVKSFLIKNGHKHSGV